MTDPAIRRLGGIGLAGVLVLILLALFADSPVMPSYLSAWLVVAAGPLGALPLVMAYDLLRRPDGPVVAALRKLLPLMVPAAILALPLAFARGGLYPTTAIATGFAAAWMQTSAIVLRGLLAGALWLVLAFVFRQPPEPQSEEARGRLAGFGLIAHLVFGTLIVVDWVGAVDPGLNASSLGLTMLVAQAGGALALAVVVARHQPGFVAPGLQPAILVLLLAWLFLHFTQYLVVWSANLPSEVPWYLARGGGLGGIAEIAAGPIALAALVVLLRPARPGVLVALSGVVLAMHGVEMFWLVTPTLRGAFSLGLADLAAAAAVLGLAAAALVVIRPTAGPALSAWRA